MNSKQLKHELATVTYNDSTDAVSLRYLLLHLLVQHNQAYRQLAGTSIGLEFLQRFRKLENANASFKEKYRNDTVTESDFNSLKNLALEGIMNISSSEAMMNAA